MQGLDVALCMNTETRVHEYRVGRRLILNSTMLARLWVAVYISMEAAMNKLRQELRIYAVACSDRVGFLDLA